MSGEKIENKYRNIIKSVVAPLKKHNASVNAMMVKIGEQFYGYDPIKKYKKKSGKNLTKERERELEIEIFRMDSELSTHEIEMLLCFICLKEGGAMLCVSESATNYKIDAMDTIQKMGKQSFSGL